MTAVVPCKYVVLLLARLGSAKLSKLVRMCGEGGFTDVLMCGRMTAARLMVKQLVNAC